MSDLLKNTAKFAIGTCVTLCTVTVGVSVAAGNSLGKVVVAGFKGAKNAIKDELAAQKENNKTNEGAVEYVHADTANSEEEIKASEN